MVFLATLWTPASPLDVRVFSNCEEVALSLNGKLLERRRPDADRTTTKLRHAPFTFRLDRFQAGTLRATGYIGGREVARDERRTPGQPDRLRLRFDLSGRPFAAGGGDVVFSYAELMDGAGTVVPDAALPVFFGTVGDARLVGRNPILSEAGVATILLQSDTVKPRCALYALGVIREQGSARILSAAASPDDTKAPSYTIRYTTDGTEPSAASPLYCGPVTNAPRLRAALLVEGRTVALADSRISAPYTSDKAGRPH